MGRTSFSGPVYGGVGLLHVVAKDSVATAQTDLEINEVRLPDDEDWFVTRVQAYCDDAGSAAAALDVEDDGDSILSGALTLTSDSSVVSVPTTDPGEDAGKRVAAGSLLTVDITTGNTSGPADVQITIVGYRRYVGAPA